MQLQLIRHATLLLEYKNRVIWRSGDRVIVICKSWCSNGSARIHSTILLPVL